MHFGEIFIDFLLDSGIEFWIIPSGFSKFYCLIQVSFLIASVSILHRCWSNAAALLLNMYLLIYPLYFVFTRHAGWLLVVANFTCIPIFCLDLGIDYGSRSTCILWYIHCRFFFTRRAGLLLVIANFTCISSFWLDLGIDYGSKRAPEIDGTVLGMHLLIHPL